MDGPFIVQQIVRRNSPGGADGDVTYNMPVLPLSALVFSLKANLTAANTGDVLVQMLDMLLSIRFFYRGTAIWSMRGSDLARMVRAFGAYSPLFENPGAGAAGQRYVSIVMPFGRRVFNPNECFPAVQSGDTQLVINWDVATALYDTPLLTLAAITLPGANPKSFLRGTTLTTTPPATGDNDFTIPRAAPILGIGVVETTSEPASATGDVETIKILLNNQDYEYSLIDRFTARAIGNLWNLDTGDDSMHLHIENTAGAYAQNASTLGGRYQQRLSREFMYLNFDPLGDSSMALPGPSAAQLTMRINFNTAAAQRFLVLEQWTPDLIFGGTRPRVG